MDITYDPLEDPLGVLLQAAASPLGGIVFTDDLELLRARLYKAKTRYAAEHPEIADLVIKTSPEDPESQLWITKANLKEALDGGQDRSERDSQLPQGQQANLQIPDNSSEGSG